MYLTMFLIILFHFNIKNSLCVVYFIIDFIVFYFILYIMKVLREKAEEKLLVETGNDGPPSIHRPAP